MKKFWNADKIVSFSAMAISLGTLVVISYQTALINNQTELIRREQRIAVMPYLGFALSYPSKNWCEIKVGNSGLGPAFIKEVKMEYQGEDYTDNLLAFYKTFFKPTNFIYNNLGPGTVIESGETIVLFGYNQSLDLFQEGLINGEIKFSITYESAYGETWVLTPPSAIPTKVDDKDIE